MNDDAFLDQFLQFCQQGGAHGFNLGQYQHTIFHSAGQYQFSVLGLGRHQHFGIDVVVRISAGNFRIAHTGHLGRVFAKEICHICHITSLLQHVVASLQIGREDIHLREPCIVAVEFVSEPCIDSRHTVIGLLYIEVHEAGVDAFGEETVSALLHLAGILGKVRPATGKGFRPYLFLSVDVSATGCGTVLNVSQVAKAPEFAANLVRLSAVLQKFAGEPPVAVILQPSGKSVLVAHFAQSAHIIV